MQPKQIPRFANCEIVQPEEIKQDLERQAEEQTSQMLGAAHLYVAEGI